MIRPAWFEIRSDDGQVADAFSDVFMERILLPAHPCLLSEPRRQGPEAAFPFRWIFFCLLLLLAALAWPALSETITTPPAALVDSSITSGVLESRIKETESASDLDEATKTRLVELYRKALTHLESIRSYEAKSAIYVSSLDTAPEETQKLHREIEILQAQAKTPPPPRPPNAELAVLEQQLTKEQADAAAVEAKLNEMDKELDNWTQRPVAARQRITEARTALEAVGEELRQPAPEGEVAALTQARKWVAETLQRALRAELQMLDRELLSQGAREDLLRALRDKTALNLQAIQGRKRVLEEQLNQRRVEEAQRARSEAEAASRAAADKHPLIRQLAQENAKLTQELTHSTDALEQVGHELAEIQDRARRLAEEYRSTRQRLEISRLSQVLGQVLLDRRQQLPDQASFRRAARQREIIIADANLRQIRYNEEQLQLRELESYIDTLLLPLAAAERSLARRAEVQEQLIKRKELLIQAQAADDTYLRVLGELDYASSELLATVTAYDDLLAEHLLWIRSAPAMSLATFADIPLAMLWLLSPNNWMEVASVLLYQAQSTAVPWLLAAVVLVLLGKRRTLRTRILELAEPLRRVRTDRFAFTLQGLLFTVLLALPWPLLLAGLGEQLAGSVEATPFAKAVGLAAISVSFGWFSLRCFFLLCISGGVADRHFCWSADILRILRRQFAWAILLLPPTAFLVALFFNHRNLAYQDSLGRVALIVLMFGLLVFAARLTHPRRGAVRNLLEAHPDGWLNRLRNLWYPLILVIPLVLIGLTLVGYTYTAGILLNSLVGELWLILGLVVLHQTIIRWIIVTRRRLALQTALERRAARAAAEAEGETAIGRNLEEEPIDLASLDEQTRRLTNALLFVTAVLGLWAIWSGVLPAFGRFEDITLWHYTGLVEGEEKILPFTLASVGLILIIVVLANIAARNLPALLEILLLQRMSVSSGGRYAVKTMTGYLIAVGAALMVFNLLGLSWGQVQWLVAALGVGIGFGLQEIVANFISGIIILFERPVRVGDVVTIGDITGSVTRIRIRATTIRNWDKQELLVPNKEFITGRLLNWTLTDTLNRLVIQVGLDYDNDVRLALRLLEEAVKEDDRVLEDPAPVFSFEGFGDNALNLVVRCYLGTMDHRIAVTTALHQAINDKFRAHGLSIAYPQRDVHLNTTQPLEVRLHGMPPGALGGPAAPPAPGSLG